MTILPRLLQRICSKSLALESFTEPVCIYFFPPSKDHVEHGTEAVRLYTEISERNDLTETERQEVTGYLEEAKRLLDIAHQDEEA